MNIKKVSYYTFVAAVFAVSFFAGNSLVKWYISTTPGEVEARAMEAHKRPDFELRDLAGKLVNVSQWDGQVIVINFWATWCPPCVREVPAFLELEQQYGPHGLQFVGIALDDPAKVSDFVDTYGVDYPILVGQQDVVDVSTSYGNRLGALPYTAVVDRKGIISKTFRGEVTKDSLENTIKQLL